MHTELLHYNRPMSSSKVSDVRAGLADGVSDLDPPLQSNRSRREEAAKVGAGAHTPTVQ